MRNEGIVELYAPRRTLIGRDGITKIPHFLQRLSSKCVLVVTDKGLIKVGTAGKVTAVLDNANIQYVVYDGVEPNPTTRIVYDALHFYQEHQCDAIIAIGGGSPIDVAKAVSILSANGGKIPISSRKSAVRRSSPSTRRPAPAPSARVPTSSRTKRRRQRCSWWTRTALRIWL